MSDERKKELLSKIYDSKLFAKQVIEEVFATWSVEELENLASTLEEKKAEIESKRIRMGHDRDFYEHEIEKLEDMKDLSSEELLRLSQEEKEGLEWFDRLREERD